VRFCERSIRREVPGEEAIDGQIGNYPDKIQYIVRLHRLQIDLTLDRKRRKKIESAGDSHRSLSRTESQLFDGQVTAAQRSHSLQRSVISPGDGHGGDIERERKIRARENDPPR